MLSALMLGAVLLAAPQEQTDTTFAVRAGGRLDVELMNGSVQIRSWDRQEIRVQAQHGRTGVVEIRQSGEVVSVEAEGRRGPPAPMTFIITVPRTFGLTVEALTAPVTIQDVDGDVVVETTNGPINVLGGQGRIELETTNGAITVRGARGRVVVATVNQGISLTDVEGDVRAEAVNGHIDLQNVRARNVDAETVNGGVTYRGAIQENGRYRFSTHNGAVRVFAPAGTNATFTVSTENGTFDTDFPLQTRGLRRGDRATFTLGTGSARVEMESFGGRIELRRAGGERN